MLSGLIAMSLPVLNHREGFFAAVLVGMVYHSRGAVAVREQDNVEILEPCFVVEVEPGDALPRPVLNWIEMMFSPQDSAPTDE